MTEYWKSQARKYCEFCKCWFADNKVSISFHESGKKHKENVQKHISQLSKKSAKDFKQKEKMDDDIKKMETAAMAAYLKDVQNNADLTSQSINEMLGQGPSVTVVPQTAQTVAVATPKSPPIWHEVRNDAGSSYFWNTKTNETTWDPPDDYLSVAEQEKRKLKEQETEKINRKEGKQKQKEALKEAKAFMAREKMRELSVKKEEPAERKSDVCYGPLPRAANPLGAWVPVRNEAEKPVDLQLPKAEKEVPPPPVIMEPEIVRFGEKRVSTLGDGPVEFKKRKINNPNRNIRKKLDDD